MKVVIAGAGGRMGRTLIEGVLKDKTLSLASAFDVPTSGLIGKDGDGLDRLTKSHLVGDQTTDADLGECPSETGTLQLVGVQVCLKGCRLREQHRLRHPEACLGKLGQVFEERDDLRCRTKRQELPGVDGPERNVVLRDDCGDSSK